MATRTANEMREHILTRAAEDPDFRAQLLADPKTVVSAELGIPIPEGFDCQVHEDSATQMHLVLPPADLLTEEELALVTGGLPDENTNWGSFDG